TTSAGTFCAANVVVATGASQAPKVPAFASELSSDVTQMHSSVYKNPGQLRDGAVLVVGLGNSGAEIAYEVCRSHKAFLSGTPSGEMPGPHGAMTAAFVLLLHFLGCRFGSVVVLMLNLAASSSGNMSSTQTLQTCNRAWAATPAMWYVRSRSGCVEAGSTRNTGWSGAILRSTESGET